MFRCLPTPVIVKEPSASLWSSNGVMLRPTALGAAYNDQVGIVPAAGNSRPMVMPPPNGTTPRSTSALPAFVVFVTKKSIEYERGGPNCQSTELNGWPTAMAGEFMDRYIV